MENHDFYDKTNKKTQNFTRGKGNSHRKDIYSQNIEINFLIFLSVFLSFIFSYLTIKYFLIFVKNFSLNAFVFYRIILALILFYIIYY